MYNRQKMQYGGYCAKEYSKAWFIRRRYRIGNVLLENLSNVQDIHTKIDILDREQYPVLAKRNILPN